MIVQHSMAAANANRQLGKNVKVNQTFSEKMCAQIRGLNKGSSNCAEGISLLQTADAALVEVQNILGRIKELTVQSANDANTADGRKAIQYEVDCLLDEIDRIGQDKPFSQNSNGSHFTIGEMNASILNIRPLDVSTQPGAGISNVKVDQAIEKISLQRAGIGAYHSHSRHAQSVDDNTSENLQAAESLIHDLDMAEGMVNYAKTNILLQAGQAMLAQANQATQGVVELLR